MNYTFRMHDPRAGRFLSLDPLQKKYPWNSPYAFSENRVIDAVELEGLEKTIYTYSLINNTRSKLELKKAGPLGNGVAVKFIDEDGKSTTFYGKSLSSFESFVKNYEGDGGLVSYQVGGKGNLTGGYGHELIGDEKKNYPEGTDIPKDEADKWLSNDLILKKDLVDRNLKVELLEKGQKEALTDFAFNIRKAPERVASFTKESGSFYFLGFRGGGGLTKRRIGKAILFDTSEYFKFEPLGKENSSKVDFLLRYYTPSEYRPLVYLPLDDKKEFGPQNK